MAHAGGKKVHIHRVTEHSEERPRHSARSKTVEDVILQGGHKYVTKTSTSCTYDESSTSGPAKHVPKAIAAPKKPAVKKPAPKPAPKKGTRC